MPDIRTPSPREAGYSAPPTRHVNTTPDDDTDLPFITTGLYVTTGGDVSLVSVGGDAVTYTVPDATMIVGQFTRLKEAGTTASGFVAVSL